MRKLLLIAALVLCTSIELQAQRIRGVMRQEWIVERGDSIAQVEILPVYIFNRPADLRRYRRLVLAVKKVYPMAKLARETMHEMEDTLLTLDKGDRRRYTKQCYKSILNEYTPVAKRMTRTEGRVFLKLIARETDYTAYEVIREFRGGFIAGFWQGVGRLFGHNLKTGYDKEQEDRVLEQIVIYYEAGLL